MKRTGLARGPLLGLVLPLLLAACGDSGTEPSDPVDAPTRGFDLGFTDFPYAASTAAVDETYRVIGDVADLVVDHFDGGVPWQEALDGTPYPVDFQASLADKVARVPRGHALYVAVTPIAFARDSLALNRGEQENEPLSAPWNALTFADSLVQTAYLNHCRRMIDQFQPDYFAYAIEANILQVENPSLWNDFISLASTVYTSLKFEYPALPVFATLQADYFNADRAGQETALSGLWPFTDLVAVSAYPYAVPIGDPGDLPADYFSALADLAPAKRFAFAETGWPAEPVTDPYPLTIPGTPALQQSYLQRVITECDARDTAFACWFFTRDYDDMWDNLLSTTPDAAIFRLWRDVGLYAGDGSARPGLGTWRTALDRPRG